MSVTVELDTPSIEHRAAIVRELAPVDVMGRSQPCAFQTPPIFWCRHGFCQEGGRAADPGVRVGRHQLHRPVLQHHQPGKSAVCTYVVCVAVCMNARVPKLLFPTQILDHGPPVVTITITPTPTHTCMHAEHPRGAAPGGHRPPCRHDGPSPSQQRRVLRRQWQWRQRRRQWRGATASRT